MISDTHDHIRAVEAAVEFFNQERVGHVVHAGDIVAQFVLARFGRLAAPMTVVYGNNDGDHPALRARASEFGFRIEEGPYLFALDGKRLAVSHQPVHPPECDYYIHGHTHFARVKPGFPLVVNPGEACGWITGRSTVALLDLVSGDVEIYEL